MKKHLNFIFIYSNKEIKDKKLTLGVYDLSSNSETWRKEYPVKKIVMHNSTDIVLVEFDGLDFTLNPTLKPICLPETKSTDGTLIVTS